MSTTAGASGTSVPFRAGWSVLVLLFGALAVNHVVGLWAYTRPGDDDAVFMAALAWLQALSVVILAVPYRRRETWAWWATWLGLAALASVATLGLVASGPAQVWPVWYLTAAAVMAIAQFVTLPSFLAPGGRVSRSGSADGQHVAVAG